MRRKVLLVIDMLKDFIEPDGALSCGEQAQRIVPFVAGKIKEFTEAGHPVIFIMDSHDSKDLEFNRFPRHCVSGTAGAQLIKELSELVVEYSNTFMVSKNRYSGFFCTNLNDILEGIKPDEVHLTGVCTNICVLYTVEELCNRDYHTLVYRDGVASFDQKAHNWALKQMESVLGAKIF